ncbi:hypothetical protein GCM10009530_51240 [Microbispora corallina]|uniref:Ricin B lectin domain-containing protein n=2 Tax=Microbispora corallina TaxID=83302 RepID=A0ABQ4G6L8_9ACTN|nr:hypothetical protein Mco01_57170 [Microbispora corallina]
MGLVLAFGVLPAGAAHANGRVTWKNVGTKRYLEVYQSSKKKGAYVGAWPWNGSKTQYWYDQKLSDRYWAEFNYNSGLLLTAYNSCGSGVTQWPTSDGRHVYSTQEWKEKHLSSDYGWVLINKAGCSGDAWHDILSISLEHPSLYQVFLYSEKSGGCSLALWPDEMGPSNYCTWK